MARTYFYSTSLHTTKRRNGLLSMRIFDFARSMQATCCQAKTSYHRTPGLTHVYRRWDDGFMIRDMTIGDAKIIQKLTSDICYPRSDDMLVAFSLSQPGLGRYIIGELKGDIASCMVSIHVAGNIFVSSYGYVADNCRNLGIYKRMFDTLRQPFKDNNNWILMCDIVPSLFDFFNKNGFVSKHKTLCFLGVPSVDRLTSITTRIENLDSISIEAVMSYDDKCFVCPRSITRKHFLTKLLALPGETVVALDEEDNIVGYGSRRKASAANWHEIGPLYAESYDVAQDIMLSLCRGVGENESVAMHVGETNHEATELARAFGLQLPQSLVLTRFHFNGHLDEPNPRVYALTSVDASPF